MALVPRYCGDDTPSVFANLCDNTIEWEVPVKDLASITTPSRNHAYILPNDMVYVVNYAGTRFIPLNAGNEPGQPTQIENSDGYLNISGSGTYNVEIELNEQQLKNLVDKSKAFCHGGDGWFKMLEINPDGLSDFTVIFNARITRMQRGNPDTAAYTSAITVNVSYSGIFPSYGNCYIAYEANDGAKRNEFDLNDYIKVQIEDDGCIRTYMKTERITDGWLLELLTLPQTIERVDIPFTVYNDEAVGGEPVAPYVSLPVRDMSKTNLTSADSSVKLTKTIDGIKGLVYDLAVPPNTDTPTIIENTDGFLDIKYDEADSFKVTLNIAEEKIEEMKGPQGEKGEKGDPGPQGPQGEKGDGISIRITNDDGLLVINEDYDPETGTVYKLSVSDSGWQSNFTYQSNWQAYRSDPADVNYPCFRKVGKIVELAGAFTNKTAISAGTEAGLMATLPVGYRPQRPVYRLCQGSDYNKFLMTIYPSGDLTVARYGITDTTQILVNSWILIGCTFLVS